MHGIRRVSRFVLRSALGLSAVFCLLLIPEVMVSNCPAQPSELFRLDTEAPWHIEADALHYKKETRQYIAHGRVLVTKKSTTIRADHILYNETSALLTAEGEVIMSSEGGDRITADRLEMNLNTETGTIYRGMVYQAKDHFFLKGDNIRKTGPDTYLADRVSVSTCDPADPDWQITGRDLDITVEGYGSLWHATLWTGKLPVMYVPYLFFPVKTQRQTGFLVPEIQYSERKWEEYLQPFFWAINDSADATLYFHHMERRGQKLGAEYRQVFPEDSQLTVMYDYLNDRQVNDDPADDRFGYDHDKWLRPNASRYWFRAKHDQALPYGFFALLDIDYVSDQDYLREFRHGYTGFEKTEDHFEEVFGRELDDYTDTTRTNRLNVNKTWTHYSFNGALRWYDNIIERRYDSLDDTAQRLPLIELDATRHQLGETPLYTDLDSEYTYCYRRDGTKGHRLDVHPRLYLPFQWRDFLSIEPSLGVHETAWWIDSYQASRRGEDKTRSRELIDTRLDISTEIYRLFSGGPDGRTKIKHTLIPEIIHEYVSPHSDQGDYPVFSDGLDTIARKNLLTYSLTQTLTVRHPVGPSKPEAAGETPGGPAYHYREVARLKIEQSYDINEKREDDPSRWTTPEERRPFSPIRGELDLNPAAGIFLDAEARWCQYERRLLEYWTRIRLNNARGDRIAAEYRNRHRQLETVSAAASVVVNEAVTLYADHERNLYDHIDIQTRIGVLYESGCWSLDVSYIDEPDDRRYMFVVNLYGLGGVGTDVAAADIENPLDSEESD